MDAASAEFLRLYQEECRRQQEALNAAEVAPFVRASMLARVYMCAHACAGGKVLDVLRLEGLSVKASASATHTCTQKWHN